MAQTRLAVVGLNHNTASIEVREKYQLNKKELPEAHNLIVKYKDVEGVIILNTCNRLEFYIALSNGNKPFDIIRKFYLETFKNDPLCDISAFYILENVEEVTRHMFKVIAGIDSLVIGEYQIQGQIKEAYSLACERQTVEKMLHKLLHAAFRAGKRVRSSTSLGEGKQSVSGVAAEIMLSKTNPKDKIAIIGVNENTQIMAKTLSKYGYNNFIFANRTLYKAEMMAEAYGGTAIDLQSLDSALFNCDAVFTCTGAQGSVIGHETLKRLSIQDRCPETIIDMAVPRDVETKDMPAKINYFDIESLRNFLDKIVEEVRIKALPEAERIIEDEVKIFNEWHESQSDDILGAYSEKFEKIRLDLIEEIRDHYSDDMLEHIDKITKRLLHRTKSTFVRILVKESKSEIQKSKIEDVPVTVSRN